MWIILEHHDIPKVYRKLPPQVKKNYEYWKAVVAINGPDKLREFPGFHDEKLKGERQGQRSSRLSRQYRVIYTVSGEEITVYILELTPHNY
jgi:plasmid maintenance system killer protein